MKHLGKKLLLAAMLLAFAVVPALADAAVDDFWEYAYHVDYDCYVASPDGIGVNFRAGPDSSYGKVLDDPIPMKTALHIEQETTSVKNAKWGYTAYNGQHGWVYLAELTTEKPAAASEQTPAAEPASTDPAPAAEPADVAPVHPIPVADEQPTQQPDTPLTLAIIAIVVLAVAVTALLLLLLRKNKTKS